LPKRTGLESNHCEDLPFAPRPCGRQKGQTISLREIIGRLPYMRATVTIIHFAFQGRQTAKHVMKEAHQVR
jgi:hypothetical protein